jgi:hypothetical protein
MTKPEDVIMSKETPIATSEAWRSAARACREKRGEALRLPSGATILAAKPDPLEWILSGRLPQRLLAAVLDTASSASAGAPPEIGAEEILDLARFATQLVRASVLQPRIGEGPDEISLDEIPVRDRAFIFEWACRALSQPPESAAAPLPDGRSNPPQEDLSSAALERFRQK